MVKTHPSFKKESLIYLVYHVYTRNGKELLKYTVYIFFLHSQLYFAKLHVAAFACAGSPVWLRWEFTGSCTQSAQPPPMVFPL